MAPLYFGFIVLFIAAIVSNVLIKKFSNNTLKYYSLIEVIQLLGTLYVMGYFIFGLLILLNTYYNPQELYLIPSQSAEISFSLFLFLLFLAHLIHIKSFDSGDSEAFFDFSIVITLILIGFWSICTGSISKDKYETEIYQRHNVEILVYSKEIGDNGSLNIEAISISSGRHLYLKDVHPSTYKDCELNSKCIVNIKGRDLFIRAIDTNKLKYY